MFTRNFSPCKTGRKNLQGLQRLNSSNEWFVSWFRIVRCFVLETIILRFLEVVHRGKRFKFQAPIWIILDSNLPQIEYKFNFIIHHYLQKNIMDI